MRGHVYGEAARIDVIKFYFPASCSCPILALCKFGLDFPGKICFVGKPAIEAIALITTSLLAFSFQLM